MKIQSSILLTIWNKNLYFIFISINVSFFDVLIGMILLSLVFNFNFFFIKNSSDKNIPHR